MLPKCDVCAVQVLRMLMRTFLRSNCTRRYHYADCTIVQMCPSCTKKVLGDLTYREIKFVG